MPPPTTTPSAVSQQDYAFFPPAQVAIPRSDLNSSIDPRYQPAGQGMAGALSDIERRNAGLSEANTNDWLQDMAMDMDWGFWNFDPLQFDAGFGQFAGPEGSGQ
ncbi:C6 transcription factor [Neofusicoccum parvum]|nr:C6 transcription factor [Neofusicoccum parvum]